MKKQFGLTKWWGIFTLALFLYAPSIAQSPITVDQFMGVNTRAQDPIPRMKAVGIVREYHDWLFNEGYITDNTTSPAYPNNQYRWNPNYETHIQYDDFYAEIAGNNILIAPATLKSIPQVVSPFLNKNDPNLPLILAQKPIVFGTDPTLPESYISHAAYLYQYAARYGNTTFSPTRQSALIAPKLPSNELVVTGLGYLNYIENWNEQDQNSVFSPQEYAAMLSADYDGHGQTMGLIVDPDNPNQMISTVGAKNADPTIKVVMGGLENADLNYIRQMVTWFQANRSPTTTFGQIPLDVINIHRYLGNNPDFNLSTNGISPEAGGLKAFLETFVAYRDSLMPSTELWLSEFGYDTNDNSNISVPVIGGNSQYEVQAQWIVRSYLETIAAGFDRAMLFDLRDVCTGAFCPLFSSAGLLEDQTNNFKPKNAWYYTYTMKNVLTGMVFDADLTTCQDLSCPRVYRFVDANNTNKKIYAVWSPTSVDTSYTFNLSLEGATAATLVEMGVPSIKGVTSPLSGTNPNITVTERPVFVIVGDNSYVSGIGCTSNLSVSQQTCSTLKLNWDAPNGVSKFQLWYMEGNHTNNDFDLSTATLVSDEIDANLLTYTVADLPINADLTFFLIPENVVVDINNPNSPSICFIQTATLTAPNTCKIPISPAGIFDPFVNLSNATRLVDEQNTLNPFCDPSLIPQTPFWGFDFPADQSITQERVSLDLQAYYNIDALALFDGGGIGLLEIQTADSPNGPWTTFLEYETVSTNDWRFFTNILPESQPIRYLRFIASDDDLVQIGELVLCGRLSNFNPDIVPGQIQNAVVTSNSCNTVSMDVTAPFDTDIAQYKVVFGTETQFIDFTDANQTLIIEDLQPENTYNFSIITVDNIGQESAAFAITGSTLPSTECATDCNPSCPTQLCLKPSWITDLTPVKINDYFPSRLVDEQETAPVCGTNGNPISEWGFEFDPFDGVPPVMAQLDLQAVYNLDSIFLFDGNSAQTFTVDYLDENGVWQLLFNYSTQAFNVWMLQEHPEIHARYLRFSKMSVDANINEVVIHASPHISIDPPSGEIMDFVATGVACNSVNLSWTLPTNSSVNQIKLFTATSRNIPETMIPANANTFTVNNLLPNTVYEFFLFAENTMNQPTYPNIITIQTPPALNCTTDDPPNPVANLQIIETNCDQLTLNWQAPTDNDIAYYNMVIQPGNQNLSCPPIAAPIAFDLPNLQANTAYQIDLQVVDYSGQTSTVQSVSGTTLLSTQCGGTAPNGNCDPTCPSYICIEDSWITDLTPSQHLDPRRLFDEPQKGNPVCGTKGKPKTNWGEDYTPGGGFPPIIATVDLQQHYILDAIYLFDIESAGNFRVEYQNSNGVWIEIGTYYTAQFNKWYALDNLSITSRYLRFTKLLNPAKIAEVSIFGVPANN